MASPDLRARIDERQRRRERRRGIAAIVAGSGFIACSVGLGVMLVLRPPEARTWDRLVGAVFSLFLAIWAIGYGRLCLRGKMRSPEALRHGREWSWIARAWPWYGP